MRHKRLAGGRISVRGSVKGTVSAPVKPELREAYGAPRLPVPLHRPLDRSRPSRG